MIINYLRCSTEDQANSQNGINAQSDASVRWSKIQGEEISKTFSDEGISGATGIEKRPGLMAAINELSHGDILLVAKRDRLGRDPLVLAMIEATINRAGAKIISAAGEGTENDDPSSILMRRMVDAFSEYERLIIKARTKSALAAKKARGERTGGIPYGFTLAENGITLIENKKEQDVLSLIRKLRSKGLSFRKIGTELEKRGISTKKGGKWQAMTIKQLCEVVA
jgi:DNA invertase Pin-like site-specific DNA recombinase